MNLALEFENALDKALNSCAHEQVYALVTEFEPLIHNEPALHQWHTFARAWLVGMVEQKREEAIALFLSLQAEQTLAPGLRNRVLNGLGAIYEMNEQWDRALRCFQECIAVYEAEGNYFRLGSALCNLTILHWKAKDFTAALASSLRSIAIFDTYPEDEVWLHHAGIAWNTYGFVQLKRNVLDEAKKAFEKASSIFMNLDTFDTEYDQGIAYTNLGHVYRQLKEIDQADIFYQLGYELTQKTKNVRETAEALYGRCLLRLHSPNAEEFHSFLDHAFHFAHVANSYEIITDLYLTRAQWHKRQNDWDAALVDTQSAVESAESLRAKIFLPDDRARMTASRIHAYEEMVSCLCRQANESTINKNKSYTKAFRNLELAKSRTFVETLDKRLLRPPQNVPTAWLTQENELRQKLNLFYREHTDLDLAKNQQIADLEMELTQLRERIRLQDAEFQSFDTAEPLSLEAVQAALPDNGLLLEYFTVADEIWVFVITKQSVEVRTLPLRISELALAFKRVSSTTYGPLHNMTRDIDQQLYSPWILHNLYQRLIEPLGAVIKEAAFLAIIPHGLLHYVPFHALYAKDNPGPRYLTEIGGEARPLVYAPSATLLFNYCQQKPLSMQAGCFALGFNNHTLTQAEFEAQRIAQIMNGVSYVGEKATRSAFFTQANNYRFVHLSCHGWFNPTWPLLSSITIADGAIDVTDILQRLQLNAELVCLSACETGRSHIMQGDELVGLSRAFLYAGTPSVLVSQWVVDELSTRLFMENFYSELATDRQSRSMNIALALSRAQQQIRHITKDELYEAMLASSDNREDAAIKLDFLHKTSHQQDSQFLLAHPYYWAPFFLIGDRI
jgi:CHAT domain-containing protein